MENSESQTSARLLCSENLVQDLLKQAEIDRSSLSTEKRQVLIAELRKRDRTFLAFEKAHAQAEA